MAVTVMELVAMAMRRGTALEKHHRMCRQPGGLPVHHRSALEVKVVMDDVAGRRDPVLHLLRHGNSKVNSKCNDIAL